MAKLRTLDILAGNFLAVGMSEIENATVVLNASEKD